MTPREYDPMDRRPIASRKYAVFQSMAKALARMGISPNAVSMWGMMAGLLAGIAFVAVSVARVGDSPSPIAARLFLLLGAAFVQLRLLANMLDGMVAIESGKSSRVGELYNEVPDRIADIAILIGFGFAGVYAELHSAEIPIWLGLVAAICAVLVAYIRAMGKAAGAQNEFCGPMAKPHRMFAVTVGAIFCALTPIAWQTQLLIKTSGNIDSDNFDPFAGLMQSIYSAPSIVLLLIILGCVVTAVRRLLRIQKALRGKHS